MMNEDRSYYNEVRLRERLRKIYTVIRDYGEDEFYISFSGGKDSTVVSELVDMAVPGNKIPRVFVNTGIEYNLILDFVKKKSQIDDRIVMLEPTVPIKPMLEKEGYPFKSKYHSRAVREYRSKGEEAIWAKKYLHGENIWAERNCPEKLKYQFTDECNLNISEKCCDRLKKEPLKAYEKRSGRKMAILGLMPSEGGFRRNATCMSFVRDKLKSFSPLAIVDKNWEDWFVEKYNVDVSAIYREPYNLVRTGCKGCPFALRLQKELDTMQKYFPAERKQCEIIWGPVYEEYRRLNYRLKQKDEYQQMEIEEFLQ